MPASAVARPSSSQRSSWTTGACDGAISADGQILGTYLHGLFEGLEACAALLRWAGLDAVQTVDYHALRERDIERLADLVEMHLDTPRLRTLCGLGG